MVGFLPLENKEMEPNKIIKPGFLLLNNIDVCDHHLSLESIDILYVYEEREKWEQEQNQAKRCCRMCVLLERCGVKSQLHTPRVTRGH